MVTKGFLVQLLTTIILSILNFSVGYSTVWPSYTIGYYEKNSASLGGTYLPHHSDLVGSLPMLGSFIATLFGGIIADLLGRKRGELICGLICLLSWALICTAKNITVILAARFLLGFGMGLCTAMHNLFISEYTEVSTRGTLMSLTVFLYTSGILISYVMGWLCSYDVVNYFMLSLWVVFVVGLCALKETPAYLLKNGKDKEALESLKFYRGTKQASQKILDELSNIKNLLQTPIELTDKANYVIEDPEKEKLKEDVEDLFKPQPKTNAWGALCASKTSQRALIIISLLVLLFVFMGMVAVQTYAGPMFTNAVPSLSPDMCAVALAVANMLGCAVPLVLSEYLGRRVLMCSSGILVTICLLSIGVLLRWPIAPPWAVPLAMLAYCFCFQIGVGCVPFVLISECFMPEVKTLCTTIALCLMWIANFVILAVFRPVVDLIGMDGAFFAFASIAAATTAIAYVILPETSGKSIEAIHALLAKGYVQIRRRKSLEK